MEVILVDMDEVIADTTTAMVQWYKKAYGGDINYKTMLEGHSLVAGFPKEHHAIVRQQLFEPGFFRHLPVMADSQRVLEEMNKRYEIYIVSAAVEFPNSLKDKHDWLMEHFPFFTWRQLVLSGSKKMMHGDHMIDDHARHLEHFRGKPWLFTAPHNLDEGRFERINNWGEAGNIFLG
jgi:5'-nucleotidase